MRIHETLKHMNIAAMMAHHNVDNRHVLVLEMCENGSVRQLLTKTAGGLLTEPVCRRYFGQMHAAVAYLHSRSIVHRDICTDNFLLDSYDRIKLIDFGSALHFATGDPLFTSRQVGNMSCMRAKHVWRKSINIIHTGQLLYVVQQLDAMAAAAAVALARLLMHKEYN